MAAPTIEAGQLTLRLSLPDGATFANFIVAERGEVLVQALQREPIAYVWGAVGSGKSHLLQAACRAAQGGAFYLPLRELVSTDPAALEGLESAALVCMDDVDAVAGNDAWEAALFDLFNRMREAGGRVLASGAAAPGAVGLRLPDLVSRLAWGPVFQVPVLEDAGKLRALRQRARARGMDMPEEVATYLLRRHPRDMHSLFALLERLDQASLTAKRRLTIPFVRECLG